MIAGIMLGAILSGRFAGRRSPQRTVRAGYALIFAGVALNLATCWALPPGVVWNVLPIFVFCIGSALVMPSATLLMLDLFPTMRGMASSLQGFVHFALSAVVAGTIAPFLVRSLPALALGMAVAAVASFALWLVYQRRARAQLVQLDSMKRRRPAASFLAAAFAGAIAAPAVVELPATTLTIGKQKLTAEVAATPEQRDGRTHVPLQPEARPRNALRVRARRAAGVLDEEHVHPAVDRLHRQRRPDRQHRRHGAAGREPTLVARARAVRARDAQGLVRRARHRARRPCRGPARLRHGRGRAEATFAASSRPDGRSWRIRAVCSLPVVGSRVPVPTQESHVPRPSAAA